MEPQNTEEKKTIRIIATSDMHGKFLPWDYALNQKSLSGSLAQLSTALKEYRDENTLLIDAGDNLQDNFADIFKDEEIHPMIKAINMLGYDICVLGNHDFDFGMEIVKKTVTDLDAKVLTGNVYEPDGKPLADAYKILDIDGISVAVVGMITPNIKKWSAQILKGHEVTDPIEETRQILDTMNGQYDLLIGAFHMSINNEYGLAGSGVTDLCTSFPEFDFVISSHGHVQLNGTVNGISVIQNKDKAQTMMVSDFVLEYENGKWAAKTVDTRCVDISDYEPDPYFEDALAEYDNKARTDAISVVGKLESNPLVPANEISFIPTAQLQDSALINLINEVQMYYSGAAVAAAALFDINSNMQPGPIRKCDMALIYKFPNMLYKVHMTGSQLKKYLEWSARYYNTYKEGDLTVSFNPEIPTYNYDIFDGINYEINISKEPGARIENLNWSDGTPVKDDDEFDLATNNYRVNTHLITAGEIFDDTDIPTLVETDIRGDIGSIRELIGDYIVNVKGGIICSDFNNNWRITGNNWDEEMHRRAIEMVANGELIIPESDNSRCFNSTPIRIEDITE